MGKQSVNKKKKKEAQEDILLQKAIQCMERSDNKEDEDDIFGRYVASELRSIDNIHTKRLAKWQIQSIIFNVHSGTAIQPERRPSWQFPGQQFNCDQAQSIFPPPFTHPRLQRTSSSPFASSSQYLSQNID